MKTGPPHVEAHPDRQGSEMVGAPWSALGRVTALVAAVILPGKGCAPCHAEDGAAGELVLVDVVVSGGDGEPIAGLPPEAFHLIENGAAQPIVHLDAVDRRAQAGRRNRPEDTAFPPARPSVSTNRGGPPAGRTFIIVFDDVHMSIGGAARARREVTDFLDSETRSGDAVVLVVPGAELAWGARMPEGRTQLTALVEGLQGRRARPSSLMSDSEAFRIVVNGDGTAESLVRERLQAGGTLPTDAELTAARGSSPRAVAQAHEHLAAFIQAQARGIVDAARARRGLVLDSVVSALERFAGGPEPKAVLLFSEGFVNEPRERVLDGLLAAAHRSAAALYFLDVRGLAGREDAGEMSPARLSLAALRDESAGAEILARDTGGFAVMLANDLKDAFVRLSRELSCHYTLAYRRVQAGGRPPAIRVEVDRPDARVRTLGMRASPSARRAKGHADALDPDLEDALTSLHPIDGIPLRLTALALQPGAGNWVTMALAGEVGVQGLPLAKGPDGTLTATLDVLIALRHLQSAASPGAVLREWRVHLPADARPEERWLPLEHEVELPPGLCQAQLIVRDRGSGVVGSVAHTFMIPEPRRWRVSSPIVSDLMAEGDGGRPRVMVRRTFASGAIAHCYFEVYRQVPGARGGPLQLQYEYRLLDARGRPRRSTPAAPLLPEASGRLARLIEIPLTRLEPGEYTLVLGFHDETTGERLELREPVWIVMPSRPNAGIYADVLHAYLEGDLERAASLALRWAPQQMQALAVGLPSAQQDLRHAAVGLHTDLAMLLWRYGDPVRAKAHVAIGRALLRPGAPADLHRDWLLALACFQQEEGRASEALALYDECTDAHPDATLAWLGAGTAYEHAAYPDGFGGSALIMPPEVAAEKAESRLRAALRLDPALVEGHLRLGRLLERAGQLDAARQELSAVVATGGEGSLVALAHVFLGQILEDGGRLEDAARHYRAALAADPDCQIAALALAELLQVAGRREAAAEILVPALGPARGAGPSSWLDYHRGLGRDCRPAMERLRRGLALPPLGVER